MKEGKKEEGGRRKEEEEGGGGRGGGGGTAPKVRTPHKDVGNKVLLGNRRVERGRCFVWVRVACT